jgi:hypothetical protein
MEEESSDPTTAKTMIPEIPPIRHIKPSTRGNIFGRLRIFNVGGLTTDSSIKFCFLPSYLLGTDISSITAVLDSFIFESFII